MTKGKYGQEDILSRLKLERREREAVSECVKILRQKLGSTIREVIIFGSKVRGNSRKYSDIDILIVLDALSWDIKKSISELASLENIKYGVLISTIRYDVETWEKPVIRLSPFGRTVREKGIRL